MSVVASDQASPSMIASLVLLGVGVLLAAAGLGVVAVASGTVGGRADAAAGGLPTADAAAVKVYDAGPVAGLSVPANMVGSWEGELVDPETGDDLGPMTIVVQPGRIGEEVAATTYPGYDCDGTATLLAGGTGVRVFEAVDASATGESCVDAEIELSVAPDDTLAVIMCVTDSRTCESEGGTVTGALRRVG